MLNFSYNALNSVNNGLKEVEGRVVRFGRAEVSRDPKTLPGKVISVAKVIFAILLDLPLKVSVRVLDKVTAFLYEKATEVKEKHLKKKFVNRLSFMVEKINNVPFVLLQISLIPKDSDPSVKHFDSLDKIKPEEFDFKGMHGYSIGYIKRSDGTSRFFGEVEEVVDYGNKQSNRSGPLLLEEGSFTEFTPSIKLTDVVEN